MSETGVVTPEGVYLDYRPAGLATRTFGRLIDLTLQFTLLYFALTVGLVVIATGAVTLWIILAAIAVFLAVFAYPVCFEILGGGRTPGHRATGTRVVRTDGGPVRFRHAAIRSMLFLVDGIVTVGFAGSASILVSARGQRLGDMAAGTMVVRLPAAAASRAAPKVVPPELLERARGFDLRRLHSDDVDTARMLLDRGADLRAGAQLDLAERLARRLDDQLGGGALRLGDDPGDFIAVVVQAHALDEEPVAPPPAAPDEVAPAMDDRLETSSVDDPPDDLPDGPPDEPPHDPPDDTVTFEAPT